MIEVKNLPIVLRALVKWKLLRVPYLLYQVAEKQNKIICFNQVREYVFKQYLNYIELRQAL